MEIMSDPVILSTGHTYDRSSIERWLEQGHKTCPVTGMRLRHMELVPNFALRSAIADWATANGVALRAREALAPVQPVFKWEEGRAGNILHGHEEIIWALEVHGGRLFTASADKTVRVWDIASKRCVQVGAGCAGDKMLLAQLAAAASSHCILWLSSYLCATPLHATYPYFLGAGGSHTAGPVTSHCWQPSVQRQLRLHDPGAFEALFKGVQFPIDDSA